MEPDKRTTSDATPVRRRKRPLWQTLSLAVAGLLLVSWIGIVLFFRIVKPFS